MAFGKVGDMFGAFAAVRDASAREDGFHLGLAAGWLLEAQKASGGTGYAHSYHLLRGWSKPYPETTGYVIPSMLGASEALREPAYAQSAGAAGEWLLKIQQQDGSFTDLDGKKQVFDTGQIIYGLLEIAGRRKDGGYAAAAVRAGEWLASVQEADGSWARHAYNSMPHSYYSRVGAILVKLGKATGRKDLAEAGMKNLEWVISQQGGDGYFERMYFHPGAPPYLHTIVYVLEGLFLGWEAAGNKEFLDAVLRTAGRLKTMEKESGSVLFSQYGPGWKIANRERCIAGLAQWAGLALDISRATGDKEYLECAERAIGYLKAKQIKGGSPNIRGALPSSIPIWGRYGRFCLFNWNSKFFMDALLKHMAP